MTLLKIALSFFCVSGFAVTKTQLRTNVGANGRRPASAKSQLKSQLKVKTNAKQTTSSGVTFSSYVQKNARLPAFAKRPLPQDAFREVKRGTIPDVPTPTTSATPSQSQPPLSTADPFAPQTAAPAAVAAPAATTPAVPAPSVPETPPSENSQGF